MGNDESIRQDNLSQFINEYGKSRYCLEILRFFGTYPDVKFNRFAIINVMGEGGSKQLIENALAYLIHKGVVKYQMKNNDSIYSLTGSEEIRRQVLKLGKMEWQKWQLIIKSSFFRM
jgi:hypothetical protein